MVATRRAGLTAALACALLLAASCGSDDSGNAIPVTSTVVSDPSTQDIHVFSPDADGPWPVVIAFHGINGKGEDMSELSTRLARGGTVVFAPTYRTDLSTQEGNQNASRDVECGYRLATSVAADYGGDLDQPMTVVGWSLGATVVMSGGLSNTISPSGTMTACSAEVPRADVIVAIDGCYYEFEGNKFDFDPSGFGNKDADVILIAGKDDTTCAAWQSENAATALRDAGYNVDLVLLDGANHYAPIFHDLVDGEMVPIADDPPGDQTVKVILDAIAAAGTHD